MVVSPPGCRLVISAQKQRGSANTGTVDSDHVTKTKSRMLHILHCSVLMSTHHTFNHVGDFAYFNIGIIFDTVL